ncbi:MAG: hypothetical protein MJ196_12950, partial [Treponemataceae bacterium]|nr:hypothetical protein [Treponemataceae bacterium]
MLFNSFKFLLFFPVLLVFYFALPAKLKNWWLLICSYYFYMSWNAVYGILLFACTLVSYAGAMLLQKTNGEKVRTRKTILFATLVLLFSALFFYKYTNFFLKNLFRVLNIAGIGFARNGAAPQFDIILPVGISFFTFQAAGYVIDVYKKELAPERNFFTYALFVSFFPQLVAGPIERSKNLLKQFESAKTFDFNRAKDGVFIMIWGYFLKMVLADRAALFVDRVYSNIYEMDGFALIVATIFFSFQIYGDFCGYSLIAKGSAKILGFDLMDNFASPYCALNVQDFWRRWHISLSTWFRDYVYFPLGGSRCSKLRTYTNIMIVMTLSGLWHGAGWNFIAWGMLHGVLQIVDRITIKFQEKVPEILRRFYTFFWIAIGWCFFRAWSIGSALHAIKKMFIAVFVPGKVNISWAWEYYTNDIKFVWLFILLLLIVEALNYKGISVRKYLQKCSAITQILAVAFSVVLIVA